MHPWEKVLSPAYMAAPGRATQSYRGPGATWTSLQSFRRGETRLFPLGKQFLDRAAVLDRHDLAEFRLVLVPLLENVAGPRRIRIKGMVRDELMQPFGVETGHVAHDIDAAMEIEIAAVVIVLQHQVFFFDDRL